MTIVFSRVIPTLRMFDVAKAREFYLDYLGFKVDFEHRFEPELPLFLGISRGGLQLYLIVTPARPTMVRAEEMGAKIDFVMKKRADVLRRLAK